MDHLFTYISIIIALFGIVVTVLLNMFVDNAIVYTGLLIMCILLMIVVTYLYRNNINKQEQLSKNPYEDNKYSKYTKSKWKNRLIFFMTLLSFVCISFTATIIFEIYRLEINRIEYVNNNPKTKKSLNYLIINLLEYSINLHEVEIKNFQQVDSSDIQLPDSDLQLPPNNDNNTNHQPIVSSGNIDNTIPLHLNDESQINNNNPNQDVLYFAEEPEVEEVVPQTGTFLTVWSSDGAFDNVHVIWNKIEIYDVDGNFYYSEYNILLRDTYFALPIGKYILYMYDMDNVQHYTYFYVTGDYSDDYLNYAISSGGKYRFRFE